MQQLKAAAVFLFCLLTLCIRSQTMPYLEKKISLDKTNQPLSAVFKEISMQTGLIFSYNPAQVNDQKNVTIHVKKLQLRLVLDELLKGSQCVYKLKKNYVIIACNPKKEEPPPLVLSGYIYSKKDSTALQDVSVYITSGRHSAVSDQYGYFAVSYPRQQNLVTLSVAKEKFVDTVLVLINPSKEKLNIYLEPQPVAAPADTALLPVPADTVMPPVSSLADQKERKRFMDFWLRLQKMKSNFRNINDTLFSDVSVSLIPNISTNKLLSVNTVNKVSLNILAGSSKGVKYAELGGLLNIDNGKVSYVQIAGLANVVADTMKGVQIGGLFNTVRTHSKGVQVGGLFNSSGSLEGAQVGGLFNVAQRNAKGIQIAGIVNRADTLKGIQLAGIVNKAAYCEGMQIAGICNYAKNLKGLQLSVINVADSSSGIPFGLFSFVRSGYHKLEVSANELAFVNVGFQTGVEKFHNVFFAGLNTLAAEKMWTYGYGIGSTFRLKNKWYFTSGLSSQQIQPLQGQGVRLNLLNKYFAGIELACASKFRVALGPSFNVLVSDVDSPYYTNTVMLASPFAFYSRTSDHTNVRMWAGATLSLKIF